jgi:hypothetical protein
MNSMVLWLGVIVDKGYICYRSWGLYIYMLWLMILYVLSINGNTS